MIDFKLVILKNKPNSLGEFPIYLRLTKNREQRYLPTKIRCKQSEWDKDKQSIKARSNRVKLNTLLNEFKSSIESKYNKINIDERNSLSIDEFIEITAPKANSIHTSDFFELIENKIKTLSDTNKIGTARYYKESRDSIISYTKVDKLHIERINQHWLNGYEHFLRLRGCKDSGIAVRMRAIRAVYNEAISLDITTQDKYPFGKKYKVHKLKGSINYRAISIEDMQLIKNLDIEANPNLKLSKDLFLFSYYAGGINFKDLMLLKYSNITKDNRIIYIRSKTKGQFDFKLIDSAIEIVRYYQENRINTDYLFPILLSNNMTALQIEYRKQKTLSKYNKDLKEIGRICGIDFDLTSYVARHSFASNLKAFGVSTDVISEMMGHDNINTTQVYLKKLGDDIKSEAMNKLNL